MTGPDTLATQVAGRARPRPALWRQRRFLIMAAVVAMALAYLIVMGIKNTAMYYLTASELLARTPAVYGERVRLGGTAALDTVVSPRGGTTLQFSLTDGQQKVPVVYRGIVPDSFKPGGEVVVEGILLQEGVFQADVLLAKCPTKYAPL